MSKDTLKDGREPGFYIIDNELIDNYGPTIGVYGVAVYNVLAQYANKNGSRIFPSYQTIADKLGISRPKVIDTIKKLIDVGLIKKSPRIDSAGDMTSNEYMLVKLKGGKQDLPPSKQDLPPSKREQPRVVNDVNQGGKPRLPDQDPVNKTQLNNTQSSSGDDEKSNVMILSNTLQQVGIGVTEFIIDQYIDLVNDYGLHAAIAGIQSAAQNGKQHRFKYVEKCIISAAQGRESPIVPSKPVDKAQYRPVKNDLWT